MRISPAAGYSSTPLPRKLGVRDGSVVALVGAPGHFEQLLGSGAIVRHGRRGGRDLTIVFVRSLSELERRWDEIEGDMRADDVWFAWVKKASPEHAGVTDEFVRAAGLARAFIDFKVCAIDETWSGLRFKRRR